MSAEVLGVLKESSQIVCQYYMSNYQPQTNGRCFPMSPGNEDFRAAEVELNNDTEVYDCSLCAMAIMVLSENCFRTSESFLC